MELELDQEQVGSVSEIFDSDVGSVSSSVAGSEADVKDVVAVSAVVLSQESGDVSDGAAVDDSSKQGD